MALHTVAETSVELLEADAAFPMRLRDQVIGAMSLVLGRPEDLSEQDLALGQVVSDIATIGLLQERAVQEQQILAEQLQGALIGRVVIEEAKSMLAERHALPTDTAFTAIRAHAHACHTGQGLPTESR